MVDEFLENLIIDGETVDFYDASSFCPVCEGRQC